VPDDYHIFKLRSPAVELGWQETRFK